MGTSKENRFFMISNNKKPVFYNYQQLSTAVEFEVHVDGPSRISD
jgi:hypothetical protein